MKFAKLLSLYSGILLLGTLARDAAALQPMSKFVAAARQRSFAAQEQTATVRQRQAETDVTFGRLLPTFTARGTYTFNQYEAKVTVPGIGSAVITPQHQRDGVLLLEAPLLDLASRAKNEQAKLTAEVAVLQSQVVGVELERSVARLYTSYLGSEALIRATTRSLEAAQSNLEYVATRTDLGAATEVDRARATANVERARQDSAEAQLTQNLLARQLETLTGIAPTPIAEFPVDNLEAEVPISEWLASKDTPSDRLAPKLYELAEQGKRAANYALLPTITASAQERFTNATGFSGRVASFVAQGTLTWKLDYANYAQSEVQQRAIELQQVRSNRTRRDLEDAIFEAFARVQSGIAKCRAARAQRDAADKASTLTQERYALGAATQLDVTLSQREAFSAATAQIQADAELAYARLSLRIYAGRPVSDSPR
jgi:outer membrane protein TolC